MIDNQKWISRFNKNGDFIDDILNIDHIGIDILKSIFLPYPDDPKFIMIYNIRSKEAMKLKSYIDFNFDFENFQYELTTYQKD